MTVFWWMKKRGGKWDRKESKREWGEGGTRQTDRERVIDRDRDRSDTERQKDRKKIDERCGDIFGIPPILYLSDFVPSIRNLKFSSIELLFRRTVAFGSWSQWQI